MQGLENLLETQEHIGTNINGINLEIDQIISQPTIDIKERLDKTGHLMWLDESLGELMTASLQNQETVDEAQRIQQDILNASSQKVKDYLLGTLELLLQNWVEGEREQVEETPKLIENNSHISETPLEDTNIHEMLGPTNEIFDEGDSIREGDAPVYKHSKIINEILHDGRMARGVPLQVAKIISELVPGHPFTTRLLATWVQEQNPDILLEVKSENLPRAIHGAITRLMEQGVDIERHPLDKTFSAFFPEAKLLSKLFVYMVSPTWEGIEIGDMTRSEEYEHIDRLLGSIDDLILKDTNPQSSLALLKAYVKNKQYLDEQVKEENDIILQNRIVVLHKFLQERGAGVNSTFTKQQSKNFTRISNEFKQTYGIELDQRILEVLTYVLRCNKNHQPNQVPELELTLRFLPEQIRKNFLKK